MTPSGCKAYCTRSEMERLSYKAHISRPTLQSLVFCWSRICCARGKPRTSIPVNQKSEWYSSPRDLVREEHNFLVVPAGPFLRGGELGSRWQPAQVELERP